MKPKHRKLITRNNPKRVERPRGFAGISIRFWLIGFWLPENASWRDEFVAEFVVEFPHGDFHRSSRCNDPVLGLDTRGIRPLERAFAAGTLRGVSIAKGQPLDWRATQCAIPKESPQPCGGKLFVIGNSMLMCLNDCGIGGHA